MIPDLTGCIKDLVFSKSNDKPLKWLLQMRTRIHIEVLVQCSSKHRVRCMINAREMQGPLSSAISYALQLQFPLLLSLQATSSTVTPYTIPNASGRFTTALCARGFRCHQRPPSSHLPGNSHWSFMAQLQHQQIPWYWLQWALKMWVLSSWMNLCSF